jgi:uncharacterized membrane protein HdeD (DUF308 family)
MSTLRFRAPLFAPPPAGYRGAGSPTLLPLRHAEPWIVAGRTVGWRAMAVRAVVAAFVAVGALAWPTLSLRALLALLVGYASIAGVTALLTAAALRRAGGDATPLVACGLETLVLVAALVLWPAPSGMVVVALLAGWMALTGAWELVLAARLGAGTSHAAGSHALHVALVGGASVAAAPALLATLLLESVTAAAMARALLGVYGGLSAALLVALALRLRHVALGRVAVDARREARR